MPGVSFVDVIIAFLGGVLGAAIGGLGAFMLCGVSLFIGTVINLFSANPSSGNIIAWGPFFGPHVAFAGGVAAAAYAGAKGKISSGRDVVAMLVRVRDPKILLVGGGFGLLGVFLKQSLDQIPVVNGIPWVNSIALSITINALIVRLLFDKAGLINTFKRPYPSWQPWNRGVIPFLGVSLVVAFASALFGKHFPTVPGLAFSVAAMSLLLLYFGWKIPVVLHIAWAAEFTAAVTGDIGWGIAFGLLTGVLGELCAWIFLIHGNTHIDPPAMSLALVFSLFPLAVYGGVTTFPEPFSIIAAIAVLLIGVVVLKWVEKSYTTDVFLS